MNDCFLVFIKSFSLEQFSRVFTGIYQCLNLIHYALTVFRISYTNSGIKNSLFRFSMFFGSLRKVLKNSSL